MIKERETPWRGQPHLPLNVRQELILPGEANATIHFATHHLLAVADEAIERRGRFTLALSGGSTPRAIYEALLLPAYRNLIDWGSLFLFWSDERAVSPTHSESNYRMAMNAAFAHLPIPREQIFRMEAEGELATAAEAYERRILELIPDGSLDMVMLGMGVDGHTASLFPGTAALTERERLVVVNEVPQLRCHRMTMTFRAINAARTICVYIIGKEKAAALQAAATASCDPLRLPIQGVGTEERPALLIADSAATALFSSGAGAP